MCLYLQDTLLSHITHAHFNRLTKCRLMCIHAGWNRGKVSTILKSTCVDRFILYFDKGKQVNAFTWQYLNALPDWWTYRLTSTMCVEKPAWDIWRPNAVPFLLVPAHKNNKNTQEKRVHHFLQQRIADFSDLKERAGTENIAKRCGINLKIWSTAIYSVVLCRDFTGWGFGLC